MSKKIHAEQTRIKKIIIGIIGILFLFYLVSCNSTEDTSPEDVLPLPKATPPSAVEGLRVVSSTDNQAMLSWTAPTNTGTVYGTNATLSGYLVKYKTADSEFIEIDEKSEGVRLAEALTGSSTTATVIGLSADTDYTFLVAAFHSVNEVTSVTSDADAPTVEETTKSAPTPPSAVEDLRVVSSTDNQVMLTWTAPSNTGTVYGTNATLSGYLVKYKTADSEFIEIDEKSEGVRLTEALTGSSTNATVIGLSPSTSYIFLIAAVNSGNAVGLDADALTIEQTTAVASPGNLRQTQCAKTTEVGLAWDVSSEATSYKLYRNDAEITSITTNSYTDTGLTAGTKYAYTVQACSTNGCSDNSDSLTITTINDQDKNLRNLINSGKIPVDLNDYDERSREIFSRYNRDTSIVAKYLKPGGSGNRNGTSFADAAGNLGDVLNDIDASATNVYVVLLTGGNYQAGDEMAMKNHVAIIGGVGECLEPSDTVTALDGEGKYRVFYNYENNLNNTALLYGVTITNGLGVMVANRHLNVGGGGMYNKNSSPSLVRVIFSGNTADYGGGIYNFDNSFPSLVEVTFSENTAESFGGGMRNKNSSPILKGVTFSGNSAGFGGGMHNVSSSPSLVGVTFSGNTARGVGGGMYNEVSSSPSLEGVIFSGNSSGNNGGGMYNVSSSPSLVGVTFFGNRADKRGGGMYNVSSSPSLVGVTFFGNRADGMGGAMGNNNNGQAGPLIINTIFWSNTAPNGQQFYFDNYSTAQENLRLYNSILEGGTGNLVSGIANTNLNQVGFVSELGFRLSPGDPWIVEPGSAPMVISFSNIIDKDPGLLPLADNGGSVLTHAITSTSPAVNQGLYVKKSGTTFYYSTDKSTWYSEPDLSGTTITPPTDAVDLTATDATGHTRSDRPDSGAYEAR